MRISLQYQPLGKLWIVNNFFYSSITCCRWFLITLEVNHNWAESAKWRPKRAYVPYVPKTLTCLMLGYVPNIVCVLRALRVLYTRNFDVPYVTQTLACPACLKFYCALSVIQAKIKWHAIRVRRAKKLKRYRHIAYYMRQKNVMCHTRQTVNSSCPASQNSIIYGEKNDVK